VLTLFLFKGRLSLTQDAHSPTFRQKREPPLDHDQQAVGKSNQEVNVYA
jgi:hypothetical protein